MAWPTLSGVQPARDEQPAGGRPRPRPGASRTPRPNPGWRRRSGGSAHPNSSNRPIAGSPAVKALMVQADPRRDPLGVLDRLVPVQLHRAEADRVGDLDHPAGRLVPEHADGQHLRRAAASRCRPPRAAVIWRGDGAKMNPTRVGAQADRQQGVGLRGDPADLDDTGARSPRLGSDRRARRPGDRPAPSPRGPVRRPDEGLAHQHGLVAGGGQRAASTSSRTPDSATATT